MSAKLSAIDEKINSAVENLVGNMQTVAWNLSN